MTDQHPITPPPELMQEWLSEFYGSLTAPGESTLHVANRAAQWGADQELEACCEWLIAWDTCEGEKLASFLREGRRPSTSLKQQALKTLEDAPGPDYPRAMTVLSAEQHALIRKALEALSDD